MNQWPNGKNVIDDEFKIFSIKKLVASNFIGSNRHISDALAEIWCLSPVCLQITITDGGVAKVLLYSVVEEARDYSCGTIQITASDMGVKLYTAYGFVHDGNFMIYKL